MVESGIVQRVRGSLRALERLPMGAAERPPFGVVAACSGGADSLALVLVLHDLARLGLLRLTVAHVDHGMRPESSAEAESVARIAAGLGLVFDGRSIGPKALGRHQGVGIEEAMRRERYRALASVATGVGARVIATGHHRRDQAETVLLHLVRGAGLRGAGGMREVSTVGIPWWPGEGTATSVVIWRPLLAESPATLRSLVDARGLSIAEDQSNDDEAFRRNALRHRVLPMLEEIAPGAGQNMANFARLAADDNDALEAVARAALGDAHNLLGRSHLLDQPLAIRRRMVRQWVLDRAPGLELTSERTEAVVTLIERNEGGKGVELGDGWTVTFRNGGIRLWRAEAEQPVQERDGRS
jgi:tRNA(Ile)-lysidine synthetase-like protein